MSTIITRAIAAFSARNVDPQRSVITVSFVFCVAVLMILVRLPVCAVLNVKCFLSQKNLFSALPEDEWFLETAKAAIHKLMLGTSGSESEPEAELEPEPEEHVALHGEISDSDESIATPSTSGSEDSFASANNDDLESPFTDPEA